MDMSPLAGMSRLTSIQNVGICDGIGWVSWLTGWPMSRMNLALFCSQGMEL